MLEDMAALDLLAFVPFHGRVEVGSSIAMSDLDPSHTGPDQLVLKGLERVDGRKLAVFEAPAGLLGMSGTPQDQLPDGALELLLDPRTGRVRSMRLRGDMDVPLDGGVTAAASVEIEFTLR